jgi:metal-dependent amidase/aminoacylase/carboxypeptidase family protein
VFRLEGSGKGVLAPIVSTALDPEDAAAISVGANTAGVEDNVIPGEAELKLNFRFLSEDVRGQL